MKMTSLEKARAVVKILDEKKGIDIMALEIAEKTIIGDYFVIVNGTSNTHVKSLAGDVEFEMSKQGVEPFKITGKATGWILLDYSDVLVHIFTRETREYYDLERLWSDATPVDISDLITED